MRNFDVNSVKWSCLFTIIACTWTIQHLNVPEQREGRNPGWLSDIKWQLKHIWRTTKWMLATMVAPEILLGKAWCDLDCARSELDRMKEFAAEDGVPWTLTHSLFANMGGFAIRNDTEGSRCRPAQIDEGTQTELEIQVPKSNVDSESAELKKATPAPNYPNPFHLIASDIRRLREAGVLQRLPYVTIEEINDKSKSDSFARIITIFQIVWTTVQIIARAIRHLAISQLEITVAAFAACAIIIYGLNWKKPKGVEVPYTLLQYDKEIPKQVLITLKNRPGLYRVFFSEIAKSFGDTLGIKKLFSTVFGLAEVRKLGSPISNEDHIEEGGAKIILGFITGCVVFGALHIAAWNFIFPSRAEQIVWRATSLYCTNLFVFFVLALLTFSTKMENFFFVSFSISYFLARLFLLAEIFRTLCFLPPSAYVATWASNIPHVA
jgi:hypothetical protein